MRNLRSFEYGGKRIWGFDDPKDIVEIFDRLHALEKQVLDLHELLSK